MKITRYICLWLCLLVGLWMNTAKAQQPNNAQRVSDVEAGITYGESIFVISNYSCLNRFSRETASVEELLQRQVEGFYFYLQEDTHTKQVMMRRPDGSFAPLKQALSAIKQSLDEHVYLFITLFLDFNVELNLTDVFAETGLSDYLYKYADSTSWPSLKDMVEKDQRLVVFEVQGHVNSPEWVHNMNEYVNHTDPDWGNAKNTVESQEDKLKKNLSLFTGFKNVEAMQLRGGSLYETARYTPYLVNLIKDTWSSEGKVPNFILVDRFDGWVNSTLRTVRGFNLVYGAVINNDELVNYVNWDGMNNTTAGIYCFPLESGMELMLSPIVPGYKVQPEKMYAQGNQRRLMMETFRATPLPIDDNLEAFLPFNGQVNDVSLRQRPIENQGVDFGFDMSRGQTATFSGNNRINLPTAQDLRLKDHDFTVQTWLKIPKYIEGKSDYCILGSKSSAYQQALHLMIRNGKPYMGFFNNDIEGHTAIEANKWYNITWRYNKQNGEQAIFVNGKLDAVATGRPGYMGSDSIYVGYTGFSEATYFTGLLDNVAIWSRVLSDKEILGLSNQTIELQLSERPSLWKDFGWVVAIALAIALLAVLLFGQRRRKRHRHEEALLSKEMTDNGADDAADNYVYLPPSAKNCIRLFGQFQVIDKNGEDITALFTPKLKQLFILLLVSSTRGRHGIKGSEMNDYIWGKDTKSAKSLRSVSVLKLRKILERLDKVEVAFNVNTYMIVMSGSVYCDYLQCLAMLEGKRVNDRQDFERFFDIISRGEAFEGESFDWLDDAKGYVSNTAVDVMAHFIGTYQIDAEADQIILIASKMLVNDPCNEDALQYLTKSLLSQNNFKQARFAYDSFCAEYQKAYGEDFKIGFDELTTGDKLVLN